jgi:hypothetical protein
LSRAGGASRKSRLVTGPLCKALAENLVCSANAQDGLLRRKTASKDRAGAIRSDAADTEQRRKRVHAYRSAGNDIHSRLERGFYIHFCRIKQVRIVGLLQRSHRALAVAGVPALQIVQDEA